MCVSPLVGPPKVLPVGVPALSPHSVELVGVSPHFAPGPTYSISPFARLRPARLVSSLPSCLFTRVSATNSPFHQLQSVSSHFFLVFGQSKPVSSTFSLVLTHFFGVADPCSSALCLHVSSAFCVTLVSLGLGQSHSSLAVRAALPTSCLRFSCVSLLGFSSICEVCGCPLLSSLSRPRDSHSFPSLCWQPSSFAFVFCPASLFPCTLCPVSLCPSGAFSFFHLAPASSLLSTSAGAPVLNVDAAGQPLTFRSALAGPFRSQ